MSDRPMGFGPNRDPDDGDDEQSSGQGGQGGGQGGRPEEEQLAKMLEQLLGPGAGQDLARALSSGAPLDPAALGPVLGQLQQLFTSGGEGPVNWQLAGDTARQVVSAGGDQSVGEAQRRAVSDAVRVAELWLDERTDLPSAGPRVLAWSRAEWVEGTLPVWHRLVEPVAESVGGAMADAMSRQAPPELAPMIGAAGQMMRQVGGSVFGLQLGQALGGLAAEVLGGTEVGLPLAPDGAVALVPANIEEFGSGLDVPRDELMLHAALREAARTRLFAHVTWLGPRLLGAVEDYARGIVIDTDRIEEAVRQADPSDPESLQAALASDLFEPERTPQQQAALTRLETMLALVEGWVERVTDAAGAGHLPHAEALRETVRRRRAAGGPAEHTFASLVGLELRPRRLREAAELWRVLEESRGVDGRDEVWAHPDLLPSAEDLDDPTGYATRRADAETAGADVDAAIEQLLRGEQE